MYRIRACGCQRGDTWFVAGYGFSKDVVYCEARGIRDEGYMVRVDSLEPFDFANSLHWQHVPDCEWYR